MTAIETEIATHQVALSFEDGVTRFITVREDQTVADASYRQRINIPLDCRDGACGTCKALCESGEYDGGTYIEDALSEAEAAEGYALPCSMKPRSDLALQIATTSEVAKTGAASYTGTVVGLDRLSPTTVELAIDIPNRGELAFLPGQYVNIAVPGTEVTRSYSFANAPHEERLVFLVKLTPGGAMSTWLTERAAVGDEVTFTGPNGSFFLREARRPVLMLAGGTGLAPVLSMLRQLEVDGCDRGGRLVYGVSTDDDLVMLDEVGELVSRLPGFTWDHCVSDPASTAANKGYVTSLIGQEDLHDGDVAIYLCGPPPMVEAVRTHVAGAGLEPTGFYYEKFALAVPAPAETSPASAETSLASAEASLASAEASPVRVELETHPEARAIAGQEMLLARDLGPIGSAAVARDDGDVVRRIAGQLVAPAPAGRAASASERVETNTVEDLIEFPEARSIGGQVTFARDDSVGLTEPDPAGPPPSGSGGSTSGRVGSTSGDTTADGYTIGEEHPDISASDAIFEARAALEVGALDLTIGRLDSQQLAGYRLLAESTLPYVDGDRFLDAHGYTESNAAFHDYLFTLTGNSHLLAAYQALGVKGRMEDVLRNATWCHPRCTQDHLDIVEAFERGDRTAARDLIKAHSERSKETMRRAMAESVAATRPRFVTPGRFAGQVVVVTGAAQGIGAQVARRVAAEGGKVVLADRSPLVAEVTDELTGQGATASAVECDLEHYEGAAALVERALATYGRIDVLINNVGGAINFKPFTEFTAEQIDAEITRSLMTTLYACRAALPGMVERGRGVIVNVSSAATRGIHRIPYSAAKGGINAITASLALEYADAGIRVTATAPGGTEAPPRRISRGTPTPQSATEKAWFQAHIDQTLETSLMHRYGTLDEQAAAICFLASEEASYITGTVLPVAGGDLG
ncbi:benzoate 1,2-dioxygenase electron transfer component BenC [Nocardioides albus]|uniref:Benzoate/toluate 1,2-dioxygenase reductase subunit n=1 Tax=Nocardioides albus TaxID=1841 RepID=A0A7W5A360_9ACTN|nr:benzoate 1,2-dioxygenase electron transfer component BenC [Nocardioides albus]MBB3088620.1 benzoate/toluate 1,2-dioxygenase reductase subunit [Nocardioides albus]GGU17540.1 oxidoreductase [Nocardioides albus]